uniref:Uncharacterized protein n=1 Tax=Cucumis sativus TaxID=3659 RepID=A0A0A0K9I1_CUCSA
MRFRMTHFQAFGSSSEAPSVSLIEASAIDFLAWASRRDLSASNAGSSKGGSRCVSVPPFLVLSRLKCLLWK